MLEKMDEIVWIVRCILRNKVIISRDEVECCKLDVEDVGHLETTAKVSNWEDNVIATFSIFYT